ncbi:MAG TPA: MCE family protein [Nocardioidaceae bacterium]|nr:MCE family protein [Nocardioidaceae bacterium]
MKTRATVAALSLLGAGAFAGCSTDAGDLPLPGNTVPGDSFQITAEFQDALNLSIGAKVKVNGIDVGKVKSVETEDFRAIATLSVESDANIHEGATARLRYTTPLGELFVDIQSPKDGRELGQDDKIVPPQATTAPTVEDALASASLLINGGGIEQLKTITDEFQTAVGDRGATLRRLLDRTTTFLQQANATTTDIDGALRALAGASQALNARQDVINRAVREITPAAKVLRENTDEVTTLLQQLVKLGRSANGLVRATRSDLLMTIRELGPILDAFYSLRGRFASGLQILSKGARALQTAIPGDHGPVVVGADLGNLAIANATGSGANAANGTAATSGTGGALQLPPLPILEGLDLSLLEGLLPKTTAGGAQ